MHLIELAILNAKFTLKSQQVGHHIRGGAGLDGAASSWLTNPMTLTTARIKKYLGRYKLECLNVMKAGYQEQKLHPTQKAQGKRLGLFYLPIFTD